MSLTKGEVETLHTILRHGGKVFVTMGKTLTPQHVRTSIINRLTERKLIRLWSEPKRIGLRSGRYLYESDYALTAAGSRAYDEAIGGF